MKKLCVGIAIFMLKLVNLFFRPMKLKKQIAIISRQADEPTLDIRLMEQELNKRGIKTVILCRTMKKSIGGMLSFGMMTLKQIRIIASSKVIVLDGYCIPVSVLPKKKGQQVVQMWHALGAVKKFGWQSVDNPDGHSLAVAEKMKMHANYDHILAPCKETGSFFAEAFRTPEEKVVYMGLPRIDFLREQDESRKKELEEAYPEIRDKVNVLYVPTFRKNAVLEMEKLIDGFDFSSMNLIIKKHFLDKGDYAWAEKAGAIVDERFSSLDWMKICPKIVTDYSAISFEAAAIDREIYIYQPDSERYRAGNGLNIDMHNEAIKDYVCENEEELFIALAKPYDKAAMHAFRDKYLDIELDCCTERLCDYAVSLL